MFIWVLLDKNLKKLQSYLKSAFQICQYENFHVKFKKKKKNLGPKLFYLGIFGLEFGKTIIIFEISPLKFIKNEFLTVIVNFGIGSAFPKVPGSTL